MRSFQAFMPSTDLKNRCSIPLHIFRGWISNYASSRIPPIFSAFLFFMDKKRKSLLGRSKKIAKTFVNVRLGGIPLA